MFFGQAHEGAANLGEAQLMVLDGSKKWLSQFRGPLDAPALGLPRPAPVDENIVQDREKPGAEIAPVLEACTLLVSADQCVVHQVFGIDVAARKRACIASQSRDLANHIEPGPLCCHNAYTRQDPKLVRRRVQFLPLDQRIGES